MSNTIRRRRVSRPTRKESCTDKTKKSKRSSHHGPDAIIRVALAAILVAVATCWLIPCWRHIGFANLGDYFRRHEEFDRIKQFVLWFRENGGWMSPHVELASFPGYGNGLMAVGSNNGYAIKKGNQLLLIPESIQLSAESAKIRFSQIKPDAEAHISDLVSRYEYFQSSLERQDVMIALSLMLECPLGSTSMLYPYISILPQSVPRLDTFDDTELKMLQDPSLEALAKQSRHLLRIYFDAVQSPVRALSKAAAAKAQTGSDFSCLSFASFHRFVSIASSHAMILDNTKYLVPMADMINHAPRSPDIDDKSGSFASYHMRNVDNGGITVLADRSVEANHQIFEEYGKLDNSLYLLAHGFVPDDNPYHCAMLPAATLPRVTHPEMSVALKEFEIDSEVLESVCVPSNGAVDPLVAAYLSVSSLEQANNSKQLAKCDKSLQSKNQDDMRAECIKYPGHSATVAKVIQNSATRVLAETQTTLDEDLEMLKAFAERKEREQTLLALKFRIADKKVLRALSGGVNLSLPD